MFFNVRGCGHLLTTMKETTCLGFSKSRVSLHRVRKTMRDKALAPKVGQEAAPVLKATLFITIDLSSSALGHFRRFRRGWSVG
jgi:hypothetical protein